MASAACGACCSAALERAGTVRAVRHCRRRGQARGAGSRRSVCCPRLLAEYAPSTQAAGSATAAARSGPACSLARGAVSSCRGSRAARTT